MKTQNVVALGLLLVTSSPAAVLPDNAVIAGKTIGEWTAEWWKWVYSVPTNQNAHIDDQNGSNVRYGQGGPVFFAPGGPFNISGPLLTLNYSVPANTYLLVPIANVEWDNIDVDPPLSLPQLRDNAATLLRSATTLHASVDGVAF